MILLFAVLGGRMLVFAPFTSSTACHARAGPDHIHYYHIGSLDNESTVSTWRESTKLLNHSYSCLTELVHRHSSVRKNNSWNFSNVLILVDDH